MRNRKHLTVLALAAVIFIIATIFTESTDNDLTGAGSPFFPDLLAKANDVSMIKIQRNAGTLTLERNQEMWQVKENNGYPADINKVRELVLGVSNLLKVEPKTRKPENYERIGLQDISKNDSTAVRVTLNAGAENVVADVIIGNNKASHADNSKMSYYIRRADDPQSWLVDGKLPDKWEAKDWLDINIFEIDRARIKQVVVDHQDGEKVYIHRADSSVRDFTLDSLKPGEQVTAPFEVNNIATTFTKMTFDDVVSEKESGAESTPVYTARLTTFDGLVLTFQPYKKGDMHLVKYSASFDQAAANSTANTTAAEGSQETATGDTKATPAKPAVKTMSADEVKQEVEKYNAVWKGWMYQLPEFRIKNIGKKKADLLKKDNKPVH
ncbi:DUF4340 domain-containing protein [Kaarinaea lacus]